MTKVNLGDLYMYNSPFLPLTYVSGRIACHPTETSQHLEASTKEEFGVSEGTEGPTVASFMSGAAVYFTAVNTEGVIQRQSKSVHLEDAVGSRPGETQKEAAGWDSTRAGVWYVSTRAPSKAPTPPPTLGKYDEGHL